MIPAGEVESHEITIVGRVIFIGQRSELLRRVPLTPARLIGLMV